MAIFKEFCGNGHVLMYWPVVQNMKCSAQHSLSHAVNYVYMGTTYILCCAPPMVDHVMWALAGYAAHRKRQETKEHPPSVLVTASMCLVAAR